MVNKRQAGNVTAGTSRDAKKSRKICKSLFATSLTTDDDDISVNICYEKKRLLSQAMQ